MTIWACSGHQYIPPSARDFVWDGITSVLAQEAEPVVGRCSLAAGADQLFADAVLRLGGVLEVVIPAHGYDETLAGASLDGYRRLLRCASRVDVLPYGRPSEAAFMAAGRKVVDTSDALLAVWDGQPSRGLGGTADVVDHARATGRRVVVVWPAGLERD